MGARGLYIIQGVSQAGYSGDPGGEGWEEIEYDPWMDDLIQGLGAVGAALVNINSETNQVHLINKTARVLDR